MQLITTISIPDMTAVRKVLGWWGFGFCTKCGSVLFDCGWYEEKSRCPHCVKEHTGNPVK